MKFNVPCKSFYSAVSSVSKVINPKNALAILDNFLVEMKDGILTVTGSDMENSLTATIEVSDAEGECRFCIAARRLVELLKEMPDQGITFEVNETTYEVEISYASGKYTLVALDGNEYPQYKEAETSEGSQPIEITMTGAQLLTALENTMFAVSDDDYRPMMQGVYFDIHTDDITFVATDTHKLVRYIDRRVKPGVEGSCIMPVKPATVLRGFLDKDDEIAMTINSRNATIVTSKFTFKCSFLVGRYPDYTRVIPKNNPYTLTIDRRAFQTAVRRVGVFVDPGFALEKFRIGSERIVIKSDDTNMCSSGREQLPCAFDGPELTIGFSAIYLGEILNVIGTDDVVARLADPGRPGVFTPSENAADTDLLMLLMPMTVGEF